MRPKTLTGIFAGFAALLATVVAESAAAADVQTFQQPPPPIGATKLKIETLAEGLANPWSMAFLPDGSMLVTERPGRLRIIRNGKLDPTPVKGVPVPYVKEQAGLFDIVLHPDFASNHILYLSYAAGTDRANATRVVSATFDGAVLSNVRTIFEARPLKPTPVHFGGRLLLLGDRTMLLSLGDGFDFREKAQALDSDLGKIVRITLDGATPPDNPFTDKKGARPEIWTYGHRNVQGLALDPETHIVYETEHGPRGGDELNVIKKGDNYGWPLACFCIDYSGARITPYTTAKGTEPPLKYWTPSIAPSGLAVYRGGLFAAWNGDLLAGGLAANISQGVVMRSLRRIHMENGEPVSEERYLTGERVRDVRVGPDGAVYVATEDHDGAPVGKILRLTPQ